MAQEPFIEPPNSIRNSFESYIKRQYEAKGKSWGHEDKLRDSLQFIEDAGIDINKVSLDDFNTPELIRQVMTNPRLLLGLPTKKGKTKAGKPLKFGSSKIRDLGKSITAVLRHGGFSENNEFERFNNANKGTRNPALDQDSSLTPDDVPFRTIGFDLTVRKPSGRFILPDDDLMLRAFRETLSSIKDTSIKVGTKSVKIPEKIIKAHMLFTTATGMRQPDVNNLMSTPLTKDSLKERGEGQNLKTFLKQNTKELKINNKGNPRSYTLNPFLYGILTDAMIAANNMGIEKVFGGESTGKKIEKIYTDILFNKLIELNPSDPNPIVKEDEDGIETPHPLTHNILRKFAFSVVNRLPEEIGGGQVNADALIQHIDDGRKKSTGVRYYLALQKGVFQDTNETRGQNAFQLALLSKQPLTSDTVPDPTQTRSPVSFLENLGFDAKNLPAKLFQQNEEDLGRLGEVTRESRKERQAYDTFLEDEIGLEDNELIQRLLKITPTRKSFNDFFSTYTSNGDIPDAEEVKEAVDAFERRSQEEQNVTFETPSTPFEDQKYYSEEDEENFKQYSDLLNDNFGKSKQTPLEFFDSLKERNIDDDDDEDDDDDDEGLGFIPSFSDIQRLLRGVDIGKDLLDDILKKVDEQKRGRNVPVEEEPEIKDDKKRENKVKKWVKKNFGKVLRRTPMGAIGMTAFDAIAREIESKPDVFEREAQVSSDIVSAPPNEDGLSFLDSLENEYSQKVDLEARQPTSGIMKDSGITELNTQSLNQQQLNNIRFAKKDLQQQVADLFNEPM
jgi:hypothetical protein